MAGDVYSIGRSVVRHPLERLYTTFENHDIKTVFHKM